MRAMSDTDSPATRWLTSPEVARRFGVARDTVKRWPIPYNQTGPRGRRRYREEDVVAYLELSRRGAELEGPDTEVDRWAAKRDTMFPRP